LTAEPIGGGLAVCVFCASTSGLPQVHMDAARRLGLLIAERGHSLVYGGGNVGLMGQVARAVHDGGGRVFGAIPRALVERELAYGPADELLVTGTLRERKAEMDARADAFVALPGGFGTLEELVEVITLRQLELHERPIVVVDVAGYYRPFVALAREMVEQGFAPAGEGTLFEVADSPEAAIGLVEAGAGRPAAAAVEAKVEAAVESWEDGRTDLG
jgi:cytokinin riboside 5'-monophosphate phosphoribohydrolase